MADNRIGHGTDRTPIGADPIVPVLACLLTAYYLISTADLTWEARAAGTTIGAVLATLCLIQFVRLGVSVLCRQSRLGFGDFFSADRNNLRRVALVGLMAGFVLALPWVGVTLGIFVALAGCLTAMGVRPWTKLFAVAGATAAAVYVMFILALNSRLPRGPVEHAIAALIGAGS